MIERTTAEPETEQPRAHVLPGGLLLRVWGALLALTAVTYLASLIDLGGANLWVALLIATAKASLVALFFMHLRWERSFLGIVFLAGLMFVLFFVGITLIDTTTYRPDLIPGYAPAMPQ